MLSISPTLHSVSAQVNSSNSTVLQQRQQIDSVEENKALVRSVIEEVFDKHNLTAANM
jgi:hypothetical protein